MLLTIFGSVVLDTISTPGGTYADMLGGASIYAAMAAARFTRPNLVARGGGDLTGEHLETIRGTADTEGLEKAGRTFRYEAEYTANFLERRDIAVEPNVPEGYRPRVPEGYRGSEFVYLANEDPAHQLEVLEQFDGPRFTMCDTIGHWIEHKRDDVRRVMESVDAVIVNDSEARKMAGSYSLARCAEKMAGRRTRHIIIKKGEHGSVLFSGGAFPLPAYPVRTVADPTGAGDAFAGAVMGHLASTGATDAASLRRACAYGNVMGSFAVERNGTAGLLAADADAVKRRFGEYRAMLCGKWWN